MNRQFARAVIAAAAVMAVSACNPDALNVRDYNRPTVEGVAKDPNGIQLLATGILDAERDQWSGMVNDFGYFGRESYQYSTTDARSVSNYLIGIPGPKLDPAGFAAGNWNGRFQQMRNVKAFNKTIDASTLTDAQKRAAKGFSNTIAALDALYLIISRDTLGIPVTITDVITQPAPFVTRDSAYKFIVGTLDAAKADLQAGGAAFPFTMHTGWTGFNTPSTFLRFNRAIAARANIYRGSLGCGASCYQAGLTALAETWIPALGSAVTRTILDQGVYHIYSTTAGDTQNGASSVVNGQLYAHAQPITGADSADLRKAKLTPLAAPVPAPGAGGIPATQKFAIYPTNSSPGPVVRAEELLLLRAEANIMTGNANAALQDINAVRTTSGGLTALASLGTTQAQQLDALLYESWLSLLFEGHRWHDMRRYGRLGQLPLDRPNHFVARVMPIPNAECLARVTINKPPAGC
ncbi:MAG: RagB/SusD family nutrient uptake outer membrane protein [Gemmatimonadaceae bacterium]|nr:RagB/SusD family nutrient uptake outer membrane protein [Gemmatimonadaceae bacterium]